jgi:hypothetical protein
VALPLNPREVREGETATFRFRPASRWTSATGLVKDPDGTASQTPAATVSSVDTTIGAYTNTEDELKLLSVTGVNRGEVYQVVDGFGAVQCEVSSVDTTNRVVTLTEPLPYVPEVGAAFQGVEVTMTIAAITDRDSAYRAIVRGASAGQEAVSRFDVVIQPFRDPIDAREVRRWFVGTFPNHPWAKDEERQADFATAASQRVRIQLRSAQRYPDRLIDTDDLRVAALVALQIEVAKNGLMPGGVDPTEYQRALKFDLSDAITDILQSNLPYDADGDGDVSRSTDIVFADAELYR